MLIGDVLRVGAALLEVTQPRIPCRKMAVRLGVGDMPARRDARAATWRATDGVNSSACIA